jgi:hypothetical protein
MHKRTVRTDDRQVQEPARMVRVDFVFHFREISRSRYKSRLRDSRRVQSFRLVRHG